MAHFAAVRIVAERDDLPGPELWLVIERSCNQASYLKLSKNLERPKSAEVRPEEFYRLRRATIRAQAQAKPRGYTHTVEVSPANVK